MLIPTLQKTKVCSCLEVMGAGRVGRSGCPWGLKDEDAVCSVTFKENKKGGSNDEAAKTADKRNQRNPDPKLVGPVFPRTKGIGEC